MARRRAANDPAVRVELSPRQREVLEHIARGHTNGEIAERLGISLDGVKWHVREILSRLGVESREEAAAWWRDGGGKRRLLRGWMWRPVVVAAGVIGTIAAVIGAVVTVAPLGGGSSTQAFGSSDETTAPTVQSVGGATQTEIPSAAKIEPSNDAATFREQPEMVEVENGEEWRLFVANDGLGMPDPEDAVLVLCGQHVDVLDQDGRVAMRVRTGAEPIPAINVPRGELVVSDFIARDGVGLHRLLLFDLASPRLLDAVELEGIRVRFHDVYGQALVVSGDGSLLYWDRHDSPELGQRGSRHVWRAVDLETRERMDWGAHMPEACGRGTLVPYGPSAMVVRCSIGEPYLIEAGVMPELRETPSDARLADQVYRGGYAANYVLAIEGYIPSPTVRIADAVTGVGFAEQEVRDAVDLVLIDTRRALILKTDGTLVHIDVWTGETETLPYRQPVRRYGEVALAR